MNKNQKKETKVNEIHSIQVSDKAISALSYSPNGNYLACGLTTGFISVYNDQYELLFEARVHRRGINYITWNRSSDKIITASDDCKIGIWNINNTLDKFLEGHDDHVFCLDCSAENVIASGSYDCSVKMWNIDTGNCIQTIDAHDEPVTSVRFNDSGSLLMSTSHDGSAKIWNTRTSNCVFLLQKSVPVPIGCGKFSANMKFVLTSDFSSEVNLWGVSISDEDAAKVTEPIVVTEPKRTYNGNENSRFAIPISFLGSNFIAGSEKDGEIVVWDVSKPNPSLVLTSHDAPVLSLTQNRAKKSYAASGGLDGKICVWQLVE